MTSSVQYRVVVGKRDERVEGPDDAAIVITVPLAAVLDDGFDPAVAYMRGVLKSTGPSGQLFEMLRSGEVTAALGRVAATA